MFNSFPPKKYPILLTISFSKNEKAMKGKIKSVFDQQSKDNVKYRSKDYISTRFECYFKNVDDMRPILNQVLKDTQMVISYALEKDKNVFPNDILRMGNEVSAKLNLSK
jgi:hypothetical protein